jgi:IS30 family transposase
VVVGTIDAQVDFKALHRHKHTHVRILQETWDTIDPKLGLDWSHEQTSRGSRRNQAKRISHEWIYRDILGHKWMGGTLFRYLCCLKKRRYHHCGND